MKFLIDKTAKDIVRKCDTSNLILGQLLTPLTRYADWGGKYAIDNGAYSGLREKEFMSLLSRQTSRKADCLFVACPDVVGSARRTMELWRRRDAWIADWPAALVAQDGLEDMDIPWSEMKAIFIGGRDPWKDSQAALDIVRTAVILGVWVHVGRVNTPKRFNHFHRVGANTCDGSGVSQYDGMLSKIERGLLREESPDLFSSEAVER